MTDTISVDLGSVRTRLNAARDAMQADYIERDDAVEACLVAALAGEHVLLLGPPGTGKSHLLRGLVSCIQGARYFETLLTKFSTEDEVCGPLKLSELKLHDRAVRNTEGCLPGCEVAFVDEVFKANSAVLNSCLSIMNERVYKGAPVPLRLMAAASNEMPEDDSLAAMFDRFLVRHVVDYIRHDANRIRFQRAKASGKLRAFVPPATITLAEWDAARADVERVNVPDAIVEAVAKLQSQLAASKSIVISDRRIGQCYRILQAAAWLDGATEVEADHLYTLRFCLWLKQDDIGTVVTMLDALDMGPAREAIRIIDDAMRLVEECPTDPATRYPAIPTLVGKLIDAAKRVQKYNGRLSKRATAKVAREMATLGAAKASLTAELTKRLES